MLAKNKNANKIHEENPEGIHEWDQSQSFEMFLRITDMISAKITPMHKEMIYINNIATLWIARVANNIREVLDSIPLV